MEQTAITWEQHFQQLTEQQRQITAKSVSVVCIPDEACRSLDFNVLPQEKEKHNIPKSINCTG